MERKEIESRSLAQGVAGIGGIKGGNTTDLCDADLEHIAAGKSPDKSTNVAVGVGGSARAGAKRGRRR